MMSYPCQMFTPHFTLLVIVRSLNSNYWQCTIHVSNGSLYTVSVNFDAIALCNITFDLHREYNWFKHMHRHMPWKHAHRKLLLVKDNNTLSRSRCAGVTIIMRVLLLYVLPMIKVHEHTYESVNITYGYYKRDFKVILYSYLILLKMNERITDS